MLKTSIFKVHPPVRKLFGKFFRSTKFFANISGISGDTTFSSGSFFVENFKSYNKGFGQKGRISITCKDIRKKLMQERRNVDNKFGKYEVVEPWNVSMKLKVPSSIPKPCYYQSWIQEIPPENIEIKNDNQIECMRQSCMLARKVLNYAKKIIQPGITTDDLDAQLHELIINNGAYPSPLWYHGFPKSICTSVNNVACHGIPDDRPLVEGDSLNVDVTVYLNGFHGDCSGMFAVGEIDERMKQLIRVTQECLDAAVDICRPNEKFCNIGNVIEEIANKNGYSVIPLFAGHGIGTYFHGLPDIFHFAHDIPGEMQPGMTFTIEPALSQGRPEVKVLDDGWTAVTIDEARTAQIEHTILITKSGCDVLTC